MLECFSASNGKQISTRCKETYSKTQSFRVEKCTKKRMVDDVMTSDQNCGTISSSETKNEHFQDAPASELPEIDQDSPCVSQVTESLKRIDI